jgi:hypothetical protein
MLLLLFKFYLFILGFMLSEALPTASLYTQLSSTNGGLKAAMPRVTIMGVVVKASVPTAKEHSEVVVRA